MIPFSRMLEGTDESDSDLDLDLHSDLLAPFSSFFGRFVSGSGAAGGLDGLVCLEPACACASGSWSSCFLACDRVVAVILDLDPSFGV